MVKLAPSGCVMMERLGRLTRTPVDFSSSSWLGGGSGTDAAVDELDDLLRVHVDERDDPFDRPAVEVGLSRL